MADLPAIRITAVDQASPVIAGVGRALGGFSAQVVSVAAVVQSLRASINLGDELKHMQDTLGLSIGKLDQLSIVAKLNNADLGDMAKSFKFLRGAMIESQDRSSQSAKLFQAMGVQVRDLNGNLRDVDDVLGDTAKALESIGDENIKAAAGTAIFGKSYQQIAATLRNYTDDQEKANKVLELYGGVSQTAANLSDDLGDKFTLLGEGSKRALLGALVPGLGAVGQALTELINGGGKLQSGFGQVVSEVAEWVSGSLISLKGAFEVVGVTIAGVMAAIATRSLEPLRAAREDIKRISTEVEAAQARIRTAAKFPGLDDGDQVTRRAGAPARANAPKADASKLANILGGGAGKQAVADYADEIQKLHDQMNKLAGSDGGYTNLIAANQKYQADLRAGKPINLEQVRVLMQTALAADQQAIETKQLAEAWDAAEKSIKAAVDAQHAIDDALMKSSLSIKAQNDALELEHATLGMTDNARRQFIATLALERAQLKGNYNDVALLTKQLALLRQEAADSAFVEMAEQAKQAFEQATEFASDFIFDFLNNGLKSFKNLWESFKQLAFRAIADVAAKNIVLGITTGGLAGSASASGGGGLVDGILGGMKSIFGGEMGIGGALGNISTILPTMTTLLGQGSSLFAAAGTAFAGMGSSFAALAGPIGLAAIGIPAIIKLFKKGPANRSATFGSGDLGSDPSRDVAFSGSSAFGNFGVTSDKHLNRKDVGADQAFGALLTSITTLDNTIARMVGGDLTKEIADALAAHSITVGLGKEKTDVGASGGPAQILKDRYVTVLSAIDAELGALVKNFDGTGDELAQFVVGLVSMHTTLEDAAGGFSDLMAELDKAKDPTIIDAFRQQGEAFDGLLETFDGSSSATANLTSATQGYYQSLVALIGQIREVQKAVDTMFAATRESVFLAGRDDQFVYDFLRQQADEKAATLGSLSDPAAIQALATEINDNINRAFGLLDDEGKNAKRDEFLQGIDNINTAVTQRLAEVQGNATSSAQSDIGQVKDLLTSFMAGQKATVDKNDAAVDKFVVAVEQMVTTPIPITVEGGYSAVGGP